MMLYRFDKKLRLLLFNELEKIEVAVRSTIVNIGSFITGNPFWMTDSTNFINSAKFHKTMNLINQELYKSKEDFIIHFKKTYSDPYPPAWIILEVLPFGIITNIYNIKDKKIKKKLPIIWTTNSTFRILVDHCNSNKKYMLPPLTYVEQAKYNPSNVP